MNLSHTTGFADTLHVDVLRTAVQMVNSTGNSAELRIIDDSNLQRITYTLGYVGNNGETPSLWALVKSVGDAVTYLYARPPHPDTEDRLYY